MYAVSFVVKYIFLGFLDAFDFYLLYEVYIYINAYIHMLYNWVKYGIQLSGVPNCLLCTDFNFRSFEFHFLGTFCPLQMIL